MTTPQTKIYDIETAKIESEIRGDFGKGKETRVFTDWGLHESVVTRQEGADSQSVTISDGVSSYAFGTSDAEGMRSPVDSSYYWHESSGKSYEEVTVAHFEKSGFVKSGTREIAGKTCDVWMQPSTGMIACAWKGIPLYLESHTPDGKQTSIVEATSIDEQPTVAPDTFTIPTSVKFTEEN